MPASLSVQHPQWPHHQLDVQALRAGGQRPTPFRDVVLKVHQRCNLACEYCYVYEMADQSWRDRPMAMKESIWQATADRAAEHADAHQLDRMRVILHGGEPLLAGQDQLRRLIGDFRRAFRGIAELDVQMQTNGMLLDQNVLDMLRGERVKIGVSLDGTAADHDRRRRYSNGLGSHAAVDRALRLLGTDRYREMFAGLLCIVDPTTDPIACYEALLAHQPPAIDLLLPHANWDNPPPRPDGGGSTPYADWLIAIFDQWFGASQMPTRIRLFEDLLALVLGGTSRSEQVGLSPVAVVVVETDGAIEQVDSLKSAYEGACGTGLSVLRDSFDSALEHPGVVARQIGTAALSEACLSCHHKDVCGGGHYAHRYRGEAGFDNPSVYCLDMIKIISHVGSRVEAGLKGSPE